jgi:hypothetical protein
MSNNRSVPGVPPTAALAFAENALNFVVFGTVAFAIVVSLLFLVTRDSDSLYDQIGRGGISREGDYAGSGAMTAPPESAAASAEREREIRQLLGARSDRLVRRGLPALDIEAEMAKLLEQPGEQRGHEPALLEEVRQLVLARNERRERSGLEPLDVEAEVKRTLDELDP